MHRSHRRSGVVFVAAQAWPRKGGKSHEAGRSRIYKGFLLGLVSFDDGRGFLTREALFEPGVLPPKTLLNGYVGCESVNYIESDLSFVL